MNVISVLDKGNAYRRFYFPCISMTLRMFLILYADDIVIFAECKTELQTSIDLLLKYCNRWKLIVNVNKTKIMCFRNVSWRVVHSSFIMET